MAPKKKSTGSPSTGVTTRSSSRSGTRSALGTNAGSSARLVSLDDFPKKKKARKSSTSETSSKEDKVDLEEEGSTVAEDKAVIVKKEEEEEEEEEENTESKTTAAKADSAVKTIVIERCTQCNNFKKRATELKEGLEKYIPGIKILLNPEKPRRGCFEVREEGGKTFVSLLDLKRPFKLMMDLDMEKVISDIVEKLNEV